MTDIRDYMFGEHILPEKRLAEQIASLAGVQHDFQVEPPRPSSSDRIALRVTTAGETPFELVHLFYTLDGTEPRPGSAFEQDFDPGETTWDQIGWQYVRNWQTSLPPQPDNTLVRYRIAAKISGAERWVFADSQAGQAEQATNFALWVSDLPAPGWSENAVLYHVFIDRFYPGSARDWQHPPSLGGFYGGTLRGVIEKLPYIQDLGYNTLWLSPFFSSPSHHGYDATDLYTVEPRLGSNQDIADLIAAAHKCGMRLILDFVANHWSNLHPSLAAAQRNADSPFHNWYIWKHWPDDYEGFFGEKSMPQLNLAAGSPARCYLLECARYWLEQGFDGYRLDFAYGPPLDFWVDFRRVCKQTRPDCWLFGEVIHNARAQRRFAAVFDGLIDFLLAEALRQTFGYGRWNLASFESFLGAHERFFDGLIDRLTILDNHDMNRFLYLAGDDRRRLKAGALLIYTLAGNPINYYGTEAGVSQERPTHIGERGFFEEARQPMLWDDDADQELIAFFRRLVALRKAYPALRRGVRKVVHLDAAAGTYAYLRQLESEKLVAAFNLSEDPQTLQLDLPTVTQASNLLNDQQVQIRHGTLHISLEPISGALLKLEE